MDSITCLTPINREYPNLVCEDLPHIKKLFALGNVALLESLNYKLGVVGSRKCSVYGLSVVSSIISNLSINKPNITFVSGYVDGIDLKVHKEAMEHNMCSICVLGYGFKYLLSEGGFGSNNNFLKDLSSGNVLFISQFEYEQSPTKWTFPKRNELLAGLINSLLVIEGGVKSGTLITGDYALRLKKKVFLVPHQIYSQNFGGIFELYKRGGQFISSADFIYNSTNGSDAPKPINNQEKDLLRAKISKNIVSSKATCDLTPLEENLLLSISSYPSTLGELAASCAYDLDDLFEALIKLRIKDLLYEKGGRYYVK